MEVMVGDGELLWGLLDKVGAVEVDEFEAESSAEVVFVKPGLVWLAKTAGEAVEELAKAADEARSGEGPLLGGMADCWGVAEVVELAPGKDKTGSADMLDDAGMEDEVLGSVEVAETMSLLERVETMDPWWSISRVIAEVHMVVTVVVSTTDWLPAGATESVMVKEADRAVINAPSVPKVG
jgi:hypothetical protein